MKKEKRKLTLRGVFFHLLFAFLVGIIGLILCLLLKERTWIGMSLLVGGIAYSLFLSFAIHYVSYVSFMDRIKPLSKEDEWDDLEEIG